MPLDDAARVQRLREAPRPHPPIRERMGRFCQALQTRICREIERLDTSARFSDGEEGSPGDGSVRRMEGGAVFARGRVAVVSVHGELDEAAAERLGTAPQPFAVTGLSAALYPENPYVPSVRFSLRHVRMGRDGAPSGQGFGGGAVLSALYPFREDEDRFLRVWAAVCDRHPGADVQRFRHTDGAGIVFDRLREDPEGAFHFVREVGRALLSAYVPLVERRRETAWGEGEASRQRRRLEDAAQTEGVWAPGPEALRFLGLAAGPG